MKLNINFSLQTSVILLLVMLIIPLSGIIMVTTYIRSADSVKKLSNSIMERIASQTVEKSLNYLKPARRGLELSSGLADVRILTGDQVEEIERYFRQLLIQYPEFIMLNYGLEDGNFMMVKRMPDGSFSTKWIQRKGHWAYTEWIHENPEWAKKFKDKGEKASDAYDPRKRPWYIKAKTEGKAIWTDAYIFYSDQKPGITCASPIYSQPDGRLVGVVGVDMGIEEISKFVGSLKIGKTGKVFIIDNKGKVIAYPVKEDGDLKKLVQKEYINGKMNKHLYHIEACPDPELVSSYKALMKKVDNTGHFDRILKEHEDIRFEYNGESYIGSYDPFPDNTDWKWTIGIILPENDLMGDIRKNNEISFAVSMTVLVLALFVGITLARKITKPLERLSQEATHIRKLKLDQKDQVVSRLTEIMRLSESLDNMKSGLKSFEKYVPSELVRLLMQSGLEAKLGGKKQVLTIFFSDIVGFTKISEQLEPEVLVNVLGEYLNEMSEIVQTQQGTVDKYIGDAIMAFWGAPRLIEAHAQNACRAALHCSKRLKELNEKWGKDGLPAFNTRFGINTGEVIVGNIGCETRMDYTVIGDNVNLASRLEGINKVYGTDIIISEETYKLVNHIMVARILDYVTVVGKKETTAIYELICDKDYLTDDLDNFIRQYTKALHFYENREFKEALSIFTGCLKLNPEDRPSQLLCERCEKYIKEPPPKDWSGAFTLRSK